MGKTTAISWADATWNPWRGCARLSPGCAKCYMFRDQERYGRDPSVVVRSKTTFDDPLKWDTPSVIFTCSYSDFFIEEADGWRDEAWAIIRQTPQHVYLILSKRLELAPDRLPDWPLPNVWLGTSIENARYNFRADLLRALPAERRFISAEPLLGPLFPTVAGGVTASALGTPPEIAAVGAGRVVGGGGYEPGGSAEPEDEQGHRRERSQDPTRRAEGGDEAHRAGAHGLSPSGLDATGVRVLTTNQCEAPQQEPAASAEPYQVASDPDARHESTTAAPSQATRGRSPLDLTGIDWLIVGGESGGRDVRPMHPEWARELRDAALAAGLAFHFKQWGAYVPASQMPGASHMTAITATGRAIGIAEASETPGSVVMAYVGPGPDSGGRILDGLEHLDRPEIPATALF